MKNNYIDIWNCEIKHLPLHHQTNNEVSLSLKNGKTIMGRFTSNFAELEESISYENKALKTALQNSVKVWKSKSTLDIELAEIVILEDSGAITETQANEMEAAAVKKDNELKNSIFEVTHEYLQDTKYVGGAFALKGVATLIVK